jgi:hypothetical protein
LLGPGAPDLCRGSAALQPSDLAAHLESNLAESSFRQAWRKMFLLAETEGR